MKLANKPRLFFGAVDFVYIIPKNPVGLQIPNREKNLEQDKIQNAFYLYLKTKKQNLVTGTSSALLLRFHFGLFLKQKLFLENEAGARLNFLFQGS